MEVMVEQRPRVAQLLRELGTHPDAGTSKLTPEEFI
jgi:hypothetical protein